MTVLLKKNLVPSTHKITSIDILHVSARADDAAFKCSRATHPCSGGPAQLHRIATYPASESAPSPPLSVQQWQIATVNCVN